MTFLILRLALPIAALLVQANTAPTWSPQELYQVAATIAGEASPAFMGEDAAAAVAWTIRNRLAGGDSLAEALRAYYARGRVTEWSWRVAVAVMTAPDYEDPTGGATFALSLQDTQRFRLRPGDLVYVSPWARRYQLHLYRSNPFVKDKPGGEETCSTR